MRPPVDRGVSLNPHNPSQALSDFVEYAKRLKGDEKGEAQLFCDRFFRAFGHGGIVEAHGALEARIKFETGQTKFADCLWSPPGREGVLIEMKKRSIANLESHFPQVRDYWIEMNPEQIIGPGAQKPNYVILCNFERFLIYRQLSFVDEIRVEELVDRQSAFNFMLPQFKEPIFKNNTEAISKDAAAIIGGIFKQLVFDKSEDRATVQRFLLQCVLALFSEDFGLLPSTVFSELIGECLSGASTFDLFGGLFRQMATQKRATGGRFKDVRYFNGGLFEHVEPIELDQESLRLLEKASSFNWKYVNPSIFGSLFESTLSSKERHAFGAHFTAEQDILKIVNPTIIRPWKNRTASASTLTDLSALLHELAKFSVLDPACGCGNFLFVAYRALKEIEMQVIEKIASSFTRRATEALHLGVSKVTTQHFHGLDIQPVAVEVAKMTMMLAKELSADQWNKRVSPLLNTLDLSFDEGLPLDVLDTTIVCKDALLEDWPEFDVVIGNPPFQSKNKMQQEMDADYIRRIRQRYPEIPGRADYCVFWFRRAHDELKTGQRAGLVGTNTIRQNYSREGGLDYIVQNGGTITDAVSSQVWQGEAVVHVSIVNWTKGKGTGIKSLSIQRGDSTESPFEYGHPERINSSLSFSTDVTTARPIRTNAASGACYQGQTHGHEGFLVPREQAVSLMSKRPAYKQVLFPFLVADDLLGQADSLPTRFVIDFRKNDLLSAQEFSDLYEQIKDKVYPDMQENASKEATKTQKVSGPRQNHLKTWWRFWRARNELMDRLECLPRYITCARVTRRPIFEFVSSEIHPNDAMQVFTLSDDYSFGVLQSSIHWEWFTARCSTLKGDWRYTSDTVFDSFPWPQLPKKGDVARIAQSARTLRKIRRQLMQAHGLSLRELYRSLEDATDNPVFEEQEKLDAAVRSAYGMGKNASVLDFLLDLNSDLYGKEESGGVVQGPGLPSSVTDGDKYVSDDCVAFRDG